MRLNRCLNLDLDLFFDNCAALLYGGQDRSKYIEKISLDYGTLIISGVLVCLLWAWVLLGSLCVCCLMGLN